MYKYAFDQINISFSFLSMGLYIHCFNGEFVPLICLSNIKKKKKIAL